MEVTSFMFMVLVCETVPDHLHGYLSRFLSEIGTHVYVGNVSRRVSDEIWNRFVETNLETPGKGIIIRSNQMLEQGFEVETLGLHSKKPFDFDGMYLFSR